MSALPFPVLDFEYKYEKMFYRQFDGQTISKPIQTYNGEYHSSKPLISTLDMTAARNSFLSYQGSDGTVSSEDGGGTTYPKPQPGDPGQIFEPFEKALSDWS